MRWAIQVTAKDDTFSPITKFMSSLHHMMHLTQFHIGILWVPVTVSIGHYDCLVVGLDVLQSAHECYISSQETCRKTLQVGNV
jgi:hypothetical protein